MRKVFHLPTRLEWPDDSYAGDRNQLERTLLDAIRRVVEEVNDYGAEITPVEVGTVDEYEREQFTAANYQSERGTYLVPSYDNGGESVEVDVQEGAPEAQVIAETQEAESEASRGISAEQAFELIRTRYRASHGRPRSGVYFGVYTRLSDADDAVPYLYYLTTNRQQVEELQRLRIVAGPAHTPVALVPGNYSIVARPFGQAQLYRDNEAIGYLDNTDNLDIAVNFFVHPGRTQPSPTRYRFFPRLQILRVSREPLSTVGSETVYLADVDIWRADDDGSWTLVYGLALIYAAIRYQWEVWKIIPSEREGGQSRRRRIFSDESRDAFLSFTWEEPGQYEIRCQITLQYEDASPLPVSEQRDEQVVPLELKMAMILAQFERQSRQSDAERIWFRSATDLLNHYRNLLQQEQRHTTPNEARINALQELIADAERQLIGQTAAGPFPIRSIYTERRTSQTRPITLLVGPAQDVESDAPHTWKLIDLTWPDFYATYIGSGETPREAIIAAFEDSRTSFRGKYPPGVILARLEWPGMERYDIQPQDFVIETESWQRSAYEWLGLGAAILGGVALAAAIIFPPSAIVTGVLIVSAVAGATVSALNIVERIETNNFEWDVETFTDIANIAASLAFVGAAAARGVAGGITRGIASGRPFTLSAATRLRQLVQFERAMLYFGLGTDLSSGIILSWDTYVQLRDLDALIGEEALAEYQRIYGEEEGRERWRNERYIRILGTLARAAVNGLLIVVSVRGARQTALQRRAFLRQPRIPGAERSVSTRLGVQPGRPIDPFPEAAFRNDRAGFVQRERSIVARRTGLNAADPNIQNLSPQGAWQINASLGNLSGQQRRMLSEVMRGSQDIPTLRRFLQNGGNLEELANFLQAQPAFVRRGINTFETAANRLQEFQTLSRTLPDPHQFRWEQSNLEDHFRRHVLGESGYPNEAWKWAQRLGIAEEYGLSRADYGRLLNSNAPGDLALRQQIADNFNNAYGEYVRTVMARTDGFSRTGRGGDLVGSDGEMIWFASRDGNISTGYFPDAPTTRSPGAADDLQGILLNAIREEQAVVQIFSRSQN